MKCFHVSEKEWSLIRQYGILTGSISLSYYCIGHGQPYANTG